MAALVLGTTAGWSRYSRSHVICSLSCHAVSAIVRLESNGISRQPLWSRSPHRRKTDSWASRHGSRSNLAFCARVGATIFKVLTEATVIAETKRRCSGLRAFARLARVHGRPKHTLCLGTTQLHFIETLLEIVNQFSLSRADDFVQKALIVENPTKAR